METLSGQPLSHVILTTEALRARNLAAGLPPHIVEVALSIRTGFVVGGFDIVTGDIERLSGKAPRSLADVLAAALSTDPRGFDVQPPSAADPAVR